MEIIPKKNMGTIAMLMAMVVATMLAATVSAQMPPSCATKLSACAQYLNATNPPSSCCTPLKDALIHELPCMCTILTDRELLKAFGIDIQAASQLPAHCGMTAFSTNACNITAETPTPAGSIPPPATPTPGGNTGASSRVAWTGMSGFMGFFLVWWSIIA